jgi:hypothetical protein
MKTRVILAAVTLVVALWAGSSTARAQAEQPPTKYPDGPQTPNPKFYNPDWRQKMEKMFPSSPSKPSQSGGYDAYKLGEIAGYVVGALILLALLDWICKLANGSSKR